MLGLGYILKITQDTKYSLYITVLLFSVQAVII